MNKCNGSKHTLEDDSIVYLWREVAAFKRSRCYSVSLVRIPGVAIGHVEWVRTGTWSGHLKSGEEVWEEQTGKQWPTRRAAIEAIVRKYLNYMEVGYG
jgi:hypothetical protein